MAMMMIVRCSYFSSSWHMVWHGMVHGVQGVENATNRKLSRVSRQTIHYYEKILCTKEREKRRESRFVLLEVLCKSKKQKQQQHQRNKYMHVHRTRMVVDEMEVFYGVFFFFSLLLFGGRWGEEEWAIVVVLVLLLCWYMMMMMMMMVENAERDNNRQYNNNVHIVVIYVYCIVYALYNMQWSHPQRAHQMFTRNNVVLFYCPCLQLLSLAWLLAFLSPVDILLAFSSVLSKEAILNNGETVVCLFISFFHCLVLVASLILREYYYVFLCERETEAIHSVVMYVFILWLTYLPIHHHHCCCDHDHRYDIISFSILIQLHACIYPYCYELQLHITYT